MILINQINVLINTDQESLREINVELCEGASTFGYHVYNYLSLLLLLTSMRKSVVHSFVHFPNILMCGALRDLVPFV